MNNSATTNPDLMVIRPTPGITREKSEDDLVTKLVQPIQYVGQAPFNSITALFSIDDVMQSQGKTALVLPADSKPKPSSDEIREMDVTTFLEHIYKLVHQNESDSASVDVIDYIDCLNKNDKLSSCRKLLSTVDLKRLPSHLRRTFLMITLPIKDKLPERKALYSESLRLLSAVHGPEKAARMLRFLA